MRGSGDDPPGICGDECKLRVRGFPGEAFATGVFELPVCGSLSGGEDKIIFTGNILLSGFS